MAISLRPLISATVVATVAATIAIAPSTQEPRPSPSAVNLRATSQALQLTAAVQPLVAPTEAPRLLVDWLQRVIIPPSASAPFPTPHFPPTVSPVSLGSSIKWVYDAVEPWVEWGFDVAAYAVGWIPWVGWLAPQISIFYDFGEMIVRSITFNIADWLDRQISFGQGLRNVAVDTINSFIFLANAQLDFWLPPLPPIPPIPGSTTTMQTVEPLQSVEGASLMAAPPLSVRLREAIEGFLPRAVDPEVITDKLVTDEAVTDKVLTDEVVTKAPADEVNVETPTVDATDPTTSTHPATSTRLNQLITAAKSARPIPTVKSTLGTVSAQGEVRVSATTKPDTDTKPGTDTDTKPDKDKPAPESTPSDAGPDQTSTTNTRHEPRSATHSDKPEKKTASTD
jgi:hypothetical protein